MKGNSDMQTQTTENTTAAPIPPAASTDDIVRRGIKRILPCKLTESEFMEISKKRVAREALLTQLEGDLQREQKKRKDQIAELSEEIAKMGRELHTESEDRTVLCNEVFRRSADGTGYVFTIRLDTNSEVENRPASPSETQRYLPTMETGPGGSVLDQARSAQSNGASGSAAKVDESDAITPDEIDEDEDDEADDADEGSDKPKRGRKGKKKS